MTEDGGYHDTCTITVNANSPNENKEPPVRQRESSKDTLVGSSTKDKDKTSSYRLKNRLSKASAMRLFQKAMKSKQWGENQIILTLQNDVTIDSATITLWQTLARQNKVEIMLHFDEMQKSVLVTRTSMLLKTIANDLHPGNDVLMGLKIKALFQKNFTNPIEAYSFAPEMSVSIKIPKQLRRIESLSILIIVLKINTPC